MGRIILITGGQRSGKSNFAKELARKKTKSPIYLATSRVWDDDHKKRIERHKKDRNKEWTTIEEDKYLSQHTFYKQVVVIDCVTLWLTNFFFDNNQDIDQSLQEAKKEIDQLLVQDAEFIIVTNELGMGAHPSNMARMKFLDLQGWTNQYIAHLAEKVYLMVSGISQKIK
jgi:adenosylcobinamide kinase/adenosylcobinamide-phosphate guanylyltransferase